MLLAHAQQASPAPHLEALEALPPVIGLVLLAHAGPHVWGKGRAGGGRGWSRSARSMRGQRGSMHAGGDQIAAAADAGPLRRAPVSAAVGSTAGAASKAPFTAAARRGHASGARTCVDDVRPLDRLKGFVGDADLGHAGGLSQRNSRLVGLKACAGGGGWAGWRGSGEGWRTAPLHMLLRCGGPRHQCASLRHALEQPLLPAHPSPTLGACTHKLHLEHCRQAQPRVHNVVAVANINDLRVCGAWCVGVWGMGGWGGWGGGVGWCVGGWVWVGGWVGVGGVGGLKADRVPR